MKSCSFTPTPQEAKEIQKMMDYIGTSSASDYVHRAVKQMIRRDKAAQARAGKSVYTKK